MQLFLKIRLVTMYTFSTSQKQTIYELEEKLPLHYITVNTK